MGRVWKSEKKPQVNLGNSQCSPCPACESQFRIRGFTQNEVIVGIRGRIGLLVFHYLSVEVLYNPEGLALCLQVSNF